MNVSSYNLMCFLDYFLSVFCALDKVHFTYVIICQKFPLWSAILSGLGIAAELLLLIFPDWMSTSCSISIHFRYCLIEKFARKKLGRVFYMTFSFIMQYTALKNQGELNVDLHKDIVYYGINKK